MEENAKKGANTVQKRTIGTARNRQHVTNCCKIQCKTTNNQQKNHGRLWAMVHLHGSNELKLAMSWGQYHLGHLGTIAGSQG